MSTLEYLKEKIGIRDWFPVQLEAFKKLMGGARRLVVASPTGTGKTLIAYYSILECIKNEGSATYITPLRALSRQKALELQELVPDKKVVLSTGDKARFEEIEEEIAEADIVVATFERFDSLTRRVQDSKHVKKWIDRLKLLVVDEAHMIGDENRGPALEGSIARLLTLKPDIELILLGAAISNARDISEWISGEQVTSNWRPVPVRLYFYPSWSPSPWISEKWLRERIELTIRNGGNVLVFTMTRRHAVEAAMHFAALVEHTKPLTEEEKQKVREACKEILSEARSMLTEKLCNLMEKGVAFHHAGLPRIAREKVEDLFYNRVLRLVAATTTLAYGVNYPARMVVISNVIRYYPEKGMRDFIPRSEFLNLAGRAGRPGFDNFGEVITLIHPAKYYSEAVLRYRSLEPEPVESKLKSRILLKAQVLATLASLPGRDNLEKWVKNTLAYRKGEISLEDVDECVRFLVEHDMVVNYRATRFGQLVARLYITPDTAVYFRSLGEVEASVMSLIGILQNTYELGRVSRSEAEAVYMWTKGVPEKVILEKTKVEPGRLYYIVETMEWLIYSLSKIMRFDNIEGCDKVYVLSLSMRYGVPVDKAFKALEMEIKKNVPKHKVRRIVLSR